MTWLLLFLLSTGEVIELRIAPEMCERIVRDVKAGGLAVVDKGDGTEVAIAAATCVPNEREGA